MPVALDTLAYAQKLRENGVPQQQAEAHASAVREFIAEPLGNLVTKEDLKIAIERAVETVTLKLTVRMGVMLGAAVAALAAIQRLH